MPTPLLLLLITLLCIVANAFFVLAEFSLIRVRASRIEELARAGHKSARMVQHAQHHLHAYLAAIQLGITMASLAIGWAGEPAIAHLLTTYLPILHIESNPGLSHALSFAIAFSIITATHIVFGEQSPKLFAIQYADRVSMATIYPLEIFYRISYAPMWVLDKVSSAVARLLGYKGKSGEEPVHSDEEIRILLDEREEAGKLSLDRLMMFENLFDFGNSKVKDVMTARDKIIYLSSCDDNNTNRDILQKHKYARYPVCRSCKEGMASVSGYVHVKDVLEVVLSGKKLDLAAITKQLPTVSENESLEECLGHFQEKRIYIALAVNTEKQVTGIITIEDLVEEIVGEIRDEFDDLPPLRLSQILVPGAIRLGLPGALTKYDAIRELVAALHTAKPLFSLDEAEKAVCVREKTLTTAIGQGAAIPHARLPDISVPLIAFAAVPDGIEWNAPDGERATAIFCILTPSAMPSAQVTILAGLARLLTTPTLKERLIEAESVEDVIEVISAAEEKVPD